MRYNTLATDYDGTIAHDGVVDEATTGALFRAREAGMKLLLVTGRDLNELFTVYPQWKVFHRIVAENGALVFNPTTNESVTAAPSPPHELIERLKSRGVPMWVGRSIIGTVEPHEHAALEIIHELGLEWQIIFNKGSVMILPTGVNKATGLELVMKELKLHRDQVAAVGDAENDIAFLQAAGFPVAVANALDSVKKVAAWVSPSPRGAGVAELIEKLLSKEFA